MPRRFEPLRLLERLVDDGVDFVVVGEVACAAHGSAYPTYSLEVVCSDEGAALAIADVTVSRVRDHRRLREDAMRIELNGRTVQVVSLDHLIGLYEMKDDSISKLRSLELRVLPDEIRRREAEGR